MIEEYKFKLVRIGLQTGEQIEGIVVDFQSGFLRLHRMRSEVFEINQVNLTRSEVIRIDNIVRIQPIRFHLPQGIIPLIDQYSQAVNEVHKMVTQMRKYHVVLQGDNPSEIRDVLVQFGLEGSQFSNLDTFRINLLGKFLEAHNNFMRREIWDNFLKKAYDSKQSYRDRLIEHIDFLNKHYGMSDQDD